MLDYAYNWNKHYPCVSNKGKGKRMMHFYHTLSYIVHTLYISFIHCSYLVILCHTLFITCHTLFIHCHIVHCPFIVILYTVHTLSLIVHTLSYIVHSFFI